MGGLIGILIIIAIFITTINCIEMRDDIKDLKKELAEIKEKMFTNHMLDSAKLTEAHEIEE